MTWRSALRRAERDPDSAVPYSDTVADCSVGAARNVMQLDDRGDLAAAGIDSDSLSEAGDLGGAERFARYARRPDAARRIEPREVSDELLCVSTTRPSADATAFCNRRVYSAKRAA